jgi:hypothetical protein
MSGRIIAGISLMLIGLLLLCAKLHILPINSGALVANWWPVGVIVFGFILLDMKGHILGWLIITYGVLAQISRLGWFSVNIVDILTTWWPLALILLGAALFIRPRL